MDKKTNNKKEEKVDWEIGMIVTLVLVIVVLPIIISVFEIGTPIKGYN
jgi:hypothetical protein